MKLELINEDEWIEEQIDILKDKYPLNSNIRSKEDIEKWLDYSDLIQVLIENFDSNVIINQMTDFSNEEFSKQFTELFQSVKNKIIDNFIKDVINQ